MGQAAGSVYDRQLVLFAADHDRGVRAAVEMARAELEVRADIYGFDALAWALFKAGRLDEAAAAADQALSLGTPDPRLAYHAGMIAAAREETERARELLTAALTGRLPAAAPGAGRGADAGRAGRGRPMIRRAIVAGATLAVTLLLAAAPAAAHPLGNATINRATAVTIGLDRAASCTSSTWPRSPAYAAILDLDRDTNGRAVPMSGRVGPRQLALTSGDAWRDR